MELTMDKIEWLAKQPVITKYTSIETVELIDIAKQLLAEMDKTSVWTDAPEWATKAVVNWSAPTHYSGVYKEYTRELPKSREREIAEKHAREYEEGYPESITTVLLANRIERAINEYKEWEAN